MKHDFKAALEFCEMVSEIGMPDETVIPVWPIETEMVITHPLTVGMVKQFHFALTLSDIVTGEPTEELTAKIWVCAQLENPNEAFQAMIAEAVKLAEQKVGV